MPFTIVERRSWHQPILSVIEIPFLARLQIIPFAIKFWLLATNLHLSVDRSKKSCGCLDRPGFFCRSSSNGDYRLRFLYTLLTEDPVVISVVVSLASSLAEGPGGGGGGGGDAQQTSRANRDNAHAALSNYTYICAFPFSIPPQTKSKTLKETGKERGGKKRGMRGIGG